MASPTIEERVGVLEAGAKDIRVDLHEIQRDVRTLRDELAGRPTWAISTIITILTTGCATLATLLAVS